MGDLLNGRAALANGFTLGTHNTSELQPVTGLSLEPWQ